MKHNLYLDFNLNKKKFEEQVDKLAQKMAEEERVIPLPIELDSGNAFLPLVSLLLSQISCDNCDTNCCKSNPVTFEQGIPLMLPEYHKLSTLYSKDNFRIGKESFIIPLPCAFLKGNHCSIYDNRPFICALFPFQVGGKINGKRVMSVASSCPSGYSIAKSVNKKLWELLHFSERAKKDAN